MRIVSGFILISVVLGLLLPRAEAQANLPASIENPYRNFVGSWSGTIPVNPDKSEPFTVKVRISEEKGSMRWDYEFGAKGEKGYSRDTKWIVLTPNDARMLTHWKHHPKQLFVTSSLDTFTHVGWGRFSGAVVSSGKPAPNSFQRLTFGLRPGALTYFWEVGPNGQNVTLYSEFEFKRDGDSNVSKDSGK